MDIWEGRDDSYKPTDVKESLAQYDNYQIYDLYCNDIQYSQTDVKLFNNFLAVQRLSPYGEILCNFSAIANIYT